MSRLERLREVVAGGELSEAYLQERQGQGWTLAAVEWEREASSQEPTAEPGQLRQAIPYGLQISADCLHLEENPIEKAAMDLMLDLICEDKSISEIAAELNRKSFRSRSGAEWTRAMVFNLLPRLIEVAPEIRFREPSLVGS